MMPFELIELSTGNLVGVFGTESEALAEVAKTVQQFGLDAVETLALGLDEFPSGSGRVIAAGRELAARALDSASKNPVRSLFDWQADLRSALSTAPIRGTLTIKGLPQGKAPDAQPQRIISIETEPTATWTTGLSRRFDAAYSTALRLSNGRPALVEGNGFVNE